MWNYERKCPENKCVHITTALYLLGMYAVLIGTLDRSLEPELRMRLPLEGTIILPEVGNWEKNNKYQLQVQSKRTRSHIESGHQKPNKIN